MNRFQSQEKPIDLTEEERETIAALLHYPALEKVFDHAQPPQLEDLRRKMQSNIVELERIVRSGARSEADRAATIIEAYRTTLGFLGVLEEARKNQAK